MIALLLLWAAAAPDALEPAVREVLGELPKGWVVRREGLPPGMQGVAIGPDGERAALSILPDAMPPLTRPEARTWLLDALGVRDGAVDTGGPLGSVVVSGRLDGDRALLAWIVSPRYLVTWVGPARRARFAEKRALRVAERLTKRGSKR